jgi:hypothetical protein
MPRINRSSSERVGLIGKASSNEDGFYSRYRQQQNWIIRKTIQFVDLWNIVFGAIAYVQLQGAHNIPYIMWLIINSIAAGLLLIASSYQSGLYRSDRQKREVKGAFTYTWLASLLRYLLVATLLGLVANLYTYTEGYRGQLDSVETSGNETYVQSRFKTQLTYQFAIGVASVAFFVIDIVLKQRSSRA